MHSASSMNWDSGEICILKQLMLLNTSGYMRFLDTQASAELFMRGGGYIKDCTTVALYSTVAVMFTQGGK